MIGNYLAQKIISRAIQNPLGQKLLVLHGIGGEESAEVYYPFWLEEVLTGLDYKRPWYWFCPRVHHWLGRDSGAHSHPRWSITVVLQGALEETTPKGTELLKAGSIRFRRHWEIHSVQPAEPDTWTLYIMGRNIHTGYLYFREPIDYGNPNG